MGGDPTHHIFVHDGGLGSLARDVVVFFERHDQHRVRVFAKLDDVGHAADDGAVGISPKVVLLMGP